MSRPWPRTRAATGVRSAGAQSWEFATRAFESHSAAQPGTSALPAFRTGRAGRGIGICIGHPSGI